MTPGPPSVLRLVTPSALRRTAALAILLCLAAARLPAQARSTTMSVSVRVVRSCSIAAASTSTDAGPAVPGHLLIACGGHGASVRLEPGRSLLPVAGATAPATVSTAREAGTGMLRVAVNF